MGGYGSGGHNKAHGMVENYERLDSFGLRRFIDDYKALSGVKPFLWSGGSIIWNPVEGTAEIREGEQLRPLKLAYVEGVDGEKSRLFFHCPLCRRRVRYLYKYRNFHVCRNCLKINYRSQQRNRGTDPIRRKMRKLIEDDMGYWWWRRDYPNRSITELEVIPKPRYMRWEKYWRLLVRYRELQDEYTRAWLKDMWVVLPGDMQTALQKYMLTRH